MKFRNTWFLFLIVFFISCTSYKDLIKTSGDKYDAVENIIKVYCHTNKKNSRKYEMFRISEFKEDKQVYFFQILPQFPTNQFSLRKNDTIGSNTGFFPTNFIKYNNKLFVWNDKEKPLGIEILKELDKIKKLDSIHLRYDLGIYINPEDTIEDWENTDWSKIRDVNPPIPSFITDERIRGRKYVVCKSDISRFKDITNKFGKEVTLNCDE